MILTSPCPAHSIYLQCIGRIVRIGAKYDCVVVEFYDPVTYNARVAANSTRRALSTLSAFLSAETVARVFMGVAAGDDDEEVKLNVSELSGFVMVNGMLLHKASRDFPPEHLYDEEMKPDEVLLAIFNRVYVTDVGISRDEDTDQVNIASGPAALTSMADVNRFTPRKSQLPEPAATPTAAAAEATAASIKRLNFNKDDIDFDESTVQDMVMASADRSSEEPTEHVNMVSTPSRTRPPPPKPSNKGKEKAVDPADDSTPKASTSASFWTSTSDPEATPRAFTSNSPQGSIDFTAGPSASFSPGPSTSTPPRRSGRPKTTTPATASASQSQGRRNVVDTNRKPARDRTDRGSKIGRGPIEGADGQPRKRPSIRERMGSGEFSAPSPAASSFASASSSRPEKRKPSGLTYGDEGPGGRKIKKPKSNEYITQEEDDEMDNDGDVTMEE